MSPPKIRRLREQYDADMEIDVTKMIASQLGTFMHGKLEAKEVEGYTNEERIFTEVDGVVISGAIDLQKQVKQGKDDWTTQLNIYKWLVESVKRVPVKGLQICAIIKDYSAHDTSEGYPEAEAVMIDIPMWDSVTTEAYVRKRLEMHRNAKVNHEFGEELQACTDEERWMSETVFAVKREGRKSAIRLFKTIEEATELAEKEKGYVETRQGEPKRCTGDFCGVSKWCKQYQGEINVPA